jgi:uncharacterized protein YceH (UPF0502 family)
MLIQLTPIQARLIGVLLEKEVTTPDQYPLSLNGLTLGCNQKSNREPVMILSESDIQHRFCNTEFSDLKFSRQQLAIVCVMLLRGPQTPGELKTRTNRLAEFDNVEEVEATLNKLHDLNDEQLVVKLNREPGKRDARYSHLFSGEDGLQIVCKVTENTSNSYQNPVSNSLQTFERITLLEQQVVELTHQLAELKELVDILSE